MSHPPKILQAAFYVTDTGKRPVREWLMELASQDRKTIGADIATLEFCWPIGKPKCSPIQGVRGLYEVRSNISSGRIARVLFVLTGNRWCFCTASSKRRRRRRTRN